MAELRRQPWHDSSTFGPYRFFNVAGSESRQKTSLINQEEARTALALFSRITNDFPEINFDGRIGIVTPYRQQLGELKRTFQQRYGEKIFTGVEFNTVDAFQGRERDIIIFSCVRAAEEGGVGFLSDIRRMNVGLTRSKSSLFILGNSNFLVRNHMWKRLIEDAQARNMFTQNVHGLFNRSTRTSQRPGLPAPPPQMPPPPAPTHDANEVQATWDPMDIDTDPPPKPVRQQGMQGSRPNRARERQVPSPHPQGNRDANIICHNCGLKGHRRHECPNGRRYPNAPSAPQSLKRPAEPEYGGGAPPVKRAHTADATASNSSDLPMKDAPPAAAQPAPKGVIQRRSGPSDMFIRKKHKRPPGGPSN